MTGDEIEAFDALLKYVDAVESDAKRLHRRLRAVDADLSELGRHHNNLREKHNLLAREGAKRGPLKTGRHARR